MKGKKQILSGMLAVAVICGICFAGVSATTSAANTAENPLADVQTRTASPVFTDVPNGTWYQTAAEWCRDSGVMNSTSNTTFGPDQTMTRAMLATVLYRAAGSPDVTGTPTFPDTRADAYYSDAVIWASQNGIISGYSRDAFGTNDPVTREQIAAILWRYDGSKAVDTTAEFTDGASIAAYAAQAVNWAVDGGIITGQSDGGFHPKGNATRAQVAVILYRYLNTGAAEAPVTPDNFPNASSVSTNGGEEIALASLEHQTAAATAPEVYYTSEITPEALSAIYQQLNWTPTGKVAVKISTGEPPASNYLSPDLIGSLVQSLDGTIVETNAAYGGRASTAMHLQVAEDHGFTAIADVDIMDADGEMTLPVVGGTHLTENVVGSHYADYDSWLILSHFKGHPYGGFGGAIKNTSIGIASREGKALIHTAGDSRSSYFGAQDPFLESMAEAAKSVVDDLNGGENIVYINVMNRLSVDCDCVANPAEPDMHDIGILASRDPVALDQACVDLIYASSDGQSVVNRIEERNGIHTLEHADAIDLGSRAYRLVDMDDSI